MNILFFSVKDFERPYLDAFIKSEYHTVFCERALSLETASKAQGFDVISIFANDDASAPVLDKLDSLGVKLIAIRAAGYDNVDIKRARQLGIAVANVPEYSPYAIAEHALALMLTLNRKLIPANLQVHRHDFTVTNLIGFDLHGKTIGIIGTGKIGSTLIKILQGFDCRILAYDIHQNEELVKRYKVEYVPLSVLCREAHIISVHTNLTPKTRYMIDRNLIGLMREGVMLINTSRGACVNSEDVLRGLENGHIGFFGTDVYENEKGVFFYDWSEKKLNDPLLNRLLAYPNVLVTPHQGFATKEALNNIFETTYYNIRGWETDAGCVNDLTAIRVHGHLSGV
jgi:D-lactate dehydrogenase